MVANCINSWIYVPIMGKEYLKSEGAQMLVIIDILSVLVLIGYILWLEWSQKKYINDYKLANLEMEDFALSIQGLPHHMKYDNNEHVLRALLVSHFETVAKEQFVKNYRKDVYKNEGRSISYG